MRWSKPVRALLQPDPWALPVYRPGWGMLRKAGTYGLDLVVLSGIAWVASLPLAAQYFNLISPSALIGNMLVVPLAFVVVATGCITLLVGTVSDLGAEIFNHANRVFITWLFDIVDYFRTAPGGHTYVRSPGWLIVSAYFIMLASIGFLRSQVGKVCFTIGLAGVLAGLGVTAQVRQHVQLHVLDVGHGQALHVALTRSRAYACGYRPRILCITGYATFAKTGGKQFICLGVNAWRCEACWCREKILNDFRIQELWVSPVVQRSGVYAHCDFHRSGKRDTRSVLAAR